MAILSAEQQQAPNIESLNCGKVTWIYIEKPTDKEVDYLAQQYRFHPLNLDDVVSRVQRPKVDEYDDHLFIVLHFPVFNKANRVTTPSEVDIFISESYLITVHKSGDLKPLSQFFKDCQNDVNTCNTYMSRSSGFLFYHILDRLVNYCFPVLNKLLDNTDKIEEFIFARAVPVTIREISLLRHDLISFRRVIHPQIAVVEALESEEYPFLKEDQDVYFGDIADHIRKIWDGLEDCKEVVDGLAETSNWLTSHRIQEVMRVLTIVMAILTPATLLASIFGMNILLPGVGERTYLPFILVLVVMLAIGGGMYLFFRRRHWL